MSFEGVLHSISNLVSHWRLNETGGTVAADHVGGYDGAIGAAVDLNQPSLMVGCPTDGASMDFDPVAGSEIVVPDAAAHRPAGAFSVLCLVAFDGTVAGDPMVAKGVSATLLGYKLRTYTAGSGTMRIEFEAYCPSPPTVHRARAIASISAANLGDTYLAVGTYDGSSTLRYYQNGAIDLPVGEVDVSAAPPQHTATALYFGRHDSFAVTPSFAGRLQEVAFFDKELSAAEVFALWQAVNAPCARQRVHVQVIG